MSSGLSQKFKNFYQVDGVDVMDSIGNVSKSAFDDLPIGAVLLNDKARISKYNHTEGELTNRDPSQVFCMNFFLLLAVCGVSVQFQGCHQSHEPRPNNSVCFFMKCLKHP